MIMEKITYREVNGYMIPDLTLPPEEAKVRLGKWGMLHKDYMLKNKKVAVTIMTAEGGFWQYLANIDKQATEMYDLLVEQMKVAGGVTEELKELYQWEWVQKMGNIQQTAMEIVCSELIYI